MLDSKLELDNKEHMCDVLELNKVLDRDITQLSGGELQRFAIAMSCVQRADVCVYGKPSMYGVVTMPYSVREGINIFLDGFIPTENLRFREESLSFKMVETAEEIIIDKTRHYSYPSMTKTLGNFKLTVEGGSFTDSEIIVMLGENGTGKTTFVRLLAGDMPDEETDKQTLSVSLKPQTIAPKFPGTVRMLLIKQIKAAFMHPQFQTDVLKPMNLENIMDQDVKTLSGGELQRVAITLALGKPNVAVYLIDEPSSFLDSEQRIIASKVIKRFILHAKKTAFVIEHDFIMATYLADPCHCVRGPTSYCCYCDASTVAAFRHEPIPGVSRDHFPA
ncbi:P-loop containing nucleoside triphosphate hydrolase protein [Roridomyces roridus]|uniref:P-loop containing nucleoside triphosphate hydrolase protein n=1 Tax=Roridomyces roridus TaxID=1738132 RepID=A0AAD7BMC7_9AGAR|nr:P-loop containing nucleoside triphosphate hydrolase protein [Roridomyces roridus]